tara:strand:+ start:916 stop:1203 length:288 start_codon:yes stop_codon:yes gene_type:complete
MRWLILIMVLALVGAVAKDGCYVRELYGIGYTVHDPTERHKQMLEWLTRNAQHCKAQDYVVIWNNLAEWAGTADSPELRVRVIQGLRDADDREKK